MPQAALTQSTIQQLHQLQQLHVQQQMLALLQVPPPSLGTQAHAQLLPRPKQQQQHIGGNKKQRTHVEVKDLARAVASLYQDELKPYGRILRKRLSELAHVAGNDTSADVGTVELREVCESCPWLYTEGVDGSDWAALLVGQPQSFIDVYSAEDLYPAEMWLDAGEYFESLDESNMVLPGGRYSCAQVLSQRSLPWLAGRSLGQICHIVQLAISHKKLLGYLHGRVVPYNRSQSMIKELHAESQEPCGSTSMHNVATWDMVRQGLQHFFANMGHGEKSIPLSNLKRLFRAQFSIELSETALGYAKLSELLQDHRLVDLCEIKLQGHGYVMVPALHNDLPRNVISLSESLQSISASTNKSGEDSSILPTGSLLRERARFVPPLNVEEFLALQPSPRTTPSSQALSDVPLDEFPLPTSLLEPMLVPPFPAAPLPQSTLPTADSMTIASLPRLLGARSPPGFEIDDLKPRKANMASTDSKHELVLPRPDLVPSKRTDFRSRASGGPSLYTTREVGSHKWTTTTTSTPNF